MTDENLPKSWKGRFPFSLSIPSFVYHDTWSGNAKRLAPYVDEIELMFFEGRNPDHLPSPREIESLGAIATDQNIRYNVHLPTDISPAAFDRHERAIAVSVVAETIARSKALSPTTWTLHIPYDPTERTLGHIKAWQENAADFLDEMLTICALPAADFSIETLDYPFFWIERIIKSRNMRVCLDTGHLMLFGENPAAFYRSHKNDIPILHIHGVTAGKDHQPLPGLSQPLQNDLLGILKHYTGTVSVENFDFRKLVSSLEWLEANWGKEVKFSLR